MPHVLCCSVGHFDYFFFGGGGVGGLSSAQMLGLGVCGSVSVVWVGCVRSLLPCGTGFCCYLFDLLLLVSVCSFLTVFFLNLVSVNQLEWSVVGAVLTYPGLFSFFFFFFKGGSIEWTSSLRICVWCFIAVY